MKKAYLATCFFLSKSDQKVHFQGKYDQKVRASACSTNRDLSLSTVLKLLQAESQVYEIDQNVQDTFLRDPDPEPVL